MRKGRYGFCFQFSLYTWKYQTLSSEGSASDRVNCSRSCWVSYIKVSETFDRGNQNKTSRTIGTWQDRNFWQVCASIRRLRSVWSRSACWESPYMIFSYLWWLYWIPSQNRYHPWIILLNSYDRLQIPSITLQILQIWSQVMCLRVVRMHVLTDSTRQYNSNTQHQHQHQHRYSELAHGDDRPDVVLLEFKTWLVETLLVLQWKWAHGHAHFWGWCAHNGIQWQWTVWSKHDITCKRLTSVTIESESKAEHVYAFNGCEHTRFGFWGKLWSFRWTPWTTGRFNVTMLVPSSSSSRCMLN